MREQKMPMVRFRDLLERIRYKDWRFQVRAKNGVLFLQLRWESVCCVTGERSWQTSRKWMLSHHMTDSEVVQTALLAVLTAEEHEAREQFRYDGAAVFGPHYDVRALAKVEARDARPPQGGGMTTDE